MAENVVSFVIETLGDLLRKKIVFLQGVEEQVKKLQNDLVRIRCFLKDADRKQDEEERIRNWVSEMRAVSYDAEDVLEIFVTKIESIKRKPFLEKTVYFPMRMHCLNKVGKDIESIQLRITDISNSREKYGIGNLGEGTDVSAEELQCLRRTSAYTEDKNIVNIEEKTTFLVSELLKEDRGRRVLSITGMGGVGKTTLARKVYNHADVKAQFSCRAWVCVSERYNFMEIMKTIILQVDSISNEQLNKLEEQEAALKERLYKCLQGKRYLVVLDDIWQEKGWDCLDGLLPDEGGNGSRLLLTSRKKSVPLHADPLHIPYELKPLGQEESWMLFVKTAFADSANGSFPSDLEEIGRKIVSKCEGLPLAIAIIGRLLLQKKRLRSEWESVLENISSHLSEEDRILPILELSYRDLPPHLKFCFNYLGFFPEDYEISVQKLTLMWIAEGIIRKSDETNCLEKIAADCMKQLVNRNMVQVGDITIDDRSKAAGSMICCESLQSEKPRMKIFYRSMAAEEAMMKHH